MKILILSDDFPPQVAGGAGMIAFRMALEYVRQGHEVRVITTVTQPTNVGRSPVEGLSVEKICSNYHERWRSYISLWNPLVVSQVKKIIADYRPEIVHAHNVHRGLSYAALLVAKKSGAKVFMTAHDIMSFYPGTFTEFIDPTYLAIPATFDYRVSVRMLFKKFRWRYNPLRNFIIRKVLQKIDGVIAVSDALAQALRQNHVACQAVIHNGINVESWRVEEGQRLDFIERFNLADKKVVLFGGRLSGAKGGQLILEAIAKVVKQVPAATLLVVGRMDEYAKRMMIKAADLNLDGYIVFTDWLDEDQMKQAYAVSTVVAVPSVCFDSFPNGNLEACAAGKPVVATCFGGSREIVADGQNGFVVNPFDVESLSQAIMFCLQNSGAAQSLGENGFALVERDYQLSVVVKKYISVFSK